MTRYLTFGVLVASVVGVLGAAGQQSVFRGGSTAVRVFATVTDRDGRLVTKLTQDHFEVRDDGKPQPITQFDNSPRPIRLIVMLDVSGSMEGNLELLQASAAQLFSRLAKDDVARVGGVDHLRDLGADAFVSLGRALAFATMVRAFISLTVSVSSCCT